MPSIDKTYDNGDQYKGEVNDAGQRHGQGLFIDAEGFEFEGKWENDNLVKGRYKGLDGSYDGDWKETIKHGVGSFTWVEGDKYDGEWENDTMNGKGKYFFDNGRVYDGEYQDGIRCGWGKLNKPDGGFYEGEWFNDKCNGKGHYEDKAGSYDGDWMDNLKHGRGRWNYPTGHVFDGHWRFDKKVMEGYLWGPQQDGKPTTVTKQTYDNDGKLIKEEPSDPMSAQRALNPSSAPSLEGDFLPGFGNAGGMGGQSSGPGGAAPGLSGDSLPGFGGPGGAPLGGGFGTGAGGAAPGLSGDSLPGFGGSGGAFGGQGTGAGGAPPGLAGDSLPGFGGAGGAHSGQGTGAGGLPPGLAGDSLPGFPGGAGGAHGGNYTGAGGAQGNVRGDTLPYWGGAGGQGPTTFDIRQYNNIYRAKRDQDKKKPDEKKLWEYNFTVPYDELKLPSQKWNRTNLDVCNRELYLADAEFLKLFKVSKDQFKAFPQWKKNVYKKQLALY